MTVGTYIDESIEPRWNADGLLPAIAQDATSGEVLMLAWMNAEALALCLFITDGAESPPLHPTCFARPYVVRFASDLARPTAGTTVLTAVNRRGSQRFCWEMHAAEAAAGE